MKYLETLPADYSDIRDYAFGGDGRAGIAYISGDFDGFDSLARPLTAAEVAYEVRAAIDSDALDDAEAHALRAAAWRYRGRLHREHLARFED